MPSSVITYGKKYELSVKFGNAGLRHTPRMNALNSQFCKTFFTLSYRRQSSFHRWNEHLDDRNHPQ
jgi:hypothetical protein